MQNPEDVVPGIGGNENCRHGQHSDDNHRDFDEVPHERMIYPDSHPDVKSMGVRSGFSSTPQTEFTPCSSPFCGRRLVEARTLQHRQARVLCETLIGQRQLTEDENRASHGFNSSRMNAASAETWRHVRHGTLFNPRHRKQDSRPLPSTRLPPAQGRAHPKRAEEE